MMLVIDASILVTAMTEEGANAAWAHAMLDGADLAAPHMVVLEAANALKKLVRSRVLTGERATLAHMQMIDAPLALFPYEPLAERVWELRRAISMYDA